MKPRDATKESHLLALKSDNFPNGRGAAGRWALLHCGSYVYLCGPEGGEGVEIPVKQFNAIVDWYMRDQHHKPKQ